MSSKKDKVSIVIHGAAAASSAAAAGMAQAPTSDNAVIVPIQVAMIAAIGKIHGQELSHSAALGVLSAASAGVVGRTISQLLLGWVPVLGNAINAATAAALTEAIGWGADKILEDA